MTEGSLTRASGAMAAGTVVSRVLGYVRNIVLATAIGTQLFGSTFAVANNVPNVVYILLVGGVLNSVFVPQIVRAMREGPDGGDEYVHRLLTLSFGIMLGVTVVATASAPLIIRLYAGDNWSAQEVALSTAFAYWCLPQIFFYGVYTVLGQVLNARGRFGPMMWTPVLNNVVAITVGMLFIAVRTIDPGSDSAVAAVTDHEVVLLAGGMTLGVIVQAMALVPVIRSSGYHYRPRWNFRGYGLRRAGDLAKWTLAFVVVNQIGYLVITTIATSVDKAAKGVVDYGVGYVAYTNAYLIFLLPHAIVTVSVVTAMLPGMSAAAAEHRPAAVREQFSRALRLTAVVIVPASVAFLVLGPDIAGLLYASIDTDSARAIGTILAGFALGLVAFSGLYLTHRGFYAHEDTRTPFFLAVVVDGVNICGILLAWAVLPVEAVTTGMAVSYSVAYYVGWAVSLRLLRSRMGGLDGFRVVRTYVRLGLASVLGGLLALGVALLVHRTVGTAVLGSLTAAVLGTGVLAAGYVLAARRMHVEELTGLLSDVRSRLGRPARR